ncbi:hypothetical protein MAPG_11313 [Magnaporthiopsis poae ATCC 64411]|uniref:Clr5 domain-containing protein n=1 Tax=Magnaporthiopsis poae (strain ATCC 64411 / 73-15) TaxID=644358 RepID=A0A0C4EEY1_MAGP6|nr:hypothetical protein MAPG_11313 [Magnaporthiopsis poae ATCC 64411]
MAPPKISEEQWLELEPRVKELFRQHIPLKCKDGSRLTIPDVIAQEFRLSVTISQLEAKLKMWNVAKKLKLHEWKTVMPHLDRLKASGTKYQLFLAGQEIKESAIQRAKRVLKSKEPDGESRGAGPLQSTNELDVRHIAIMIASDDGNQWVPYRGTEARLTRSPSRPPEFGAGSGTDAPPSAPVSTDMILFSPHTGRPGAMHATGRHQELSPRIQDWAATPAFSGVLGSTASNDRFLDLDLSHRMSSPLGSFHASPLPFRVDRHPSPIITCPRTPPDHIPGVSQPMDIILSSQHILSSDMLFGRVPGLLRNILQHAADLSEKLPFGQLARQQLPEVEVLLDRLLAVLPRRETERIMNLSTETTGSELLVREMLLHSIVNNFAGLQDLPLKGILSILRNDSQMIPELSKRLRGCSQALAKTIADNLFRVAVEARDARTTELIFTAVSGQPYAIDLDGFICRQGGDNYSPLELAAKHYDIDLVSVLVRLGADVNKSRNPGIDSYVGPLGHAVTVRNWGLLGRPPEVMSNQYQVVMILLEHGAKVYRLYLSHGIDFADLLIPIALMERYHKHYKVNWLRIDWQRLGWQSDHERTVLFRRLLALCAKFGCSKCTREFRLALASAALCGHLELCKTLIQHGVTVTSLAYAWAVRGGHPDIVDLIRERGIDTALPLHEHLELPSGLYSLSQPRHMTRTYQENTTPFAEAIRCRDIQLAKMLERLGAWHRVQESVQHFEAAAIAAVEVGDLLCLRRVLDIIPNFNGSAEERSDFHPHWPLPKFPAAFLTLPLILAIRNQQHQAIAMLMDAGAQESILDLDNHIHSALCEAIQQRNKPLVSRILEMDVCFQFKREIQPKDEASPLSLAARWGDVSLVRDILHMHADFPLQVALLEAVRSKNKEIVKLLQEQSAAVCDGDILLEAMKSADTDMVELLLSRELRSLDSRGFQGLMEADSPNLEIVLEMLKERSPRVMLDCGHVLLIHAIQANNHKAIRALLASAALDINGFDSELGLNPLGCAIENAKDLRAIRSLIDMGADVNRIVALPNGIGKADKRDNNAVWPRETALLVAIKVDKRDVVALLLDKGANVNDAARLGVKRTPLQAACERGSWGIVQLLLENGADANAPPALKGGGTALQLAAMGGYIRVVEHLLSLGASVHAAPSRYDGRTALEAAAESGRLSMLDCIWAAQEGAGFPKDEITRAIRYASKNGHRGCAGYLWFLANTQPNGQGLLEDVSIE